MQFDLKNCYIIDVLLMYYKQEKEKRGRNIIFENLNKYDPKINLTIEVNLFFLNFWNKNNWQ